LIDNREINLSLNHYYKSLLHFNYFYFIYYLCDNDYFIYLLHDLIVYYLIDNLIVYDLIGD